LDVRPEGTILVVSNHDQPGFIGRVGTILGEHGINIAAWRYGRIEPYGLALSFIRTDMNVPDSVIQALVDYAPVYWIKKVQL
jgi:D-3-phosphoglycerate dehydrogenase / 2-oxoglutarate reductase